MVRRDEVDQVYLTQAEKFKAIIADIKQCTESGQPVLVGTTSIETSEHLSGLLKKAGIRHEVLNAKQHQREAQIVAQAGKPGAVTIATNMAGRGTDIVLGGNFEAEKAQLKDANELQLADLKRSWKQRHDQVIAAGGLRIIGTERHESRRIDNQLRGRSGRQGDPGSSRFYLSLQDNLMRIFANDRVAAIMQRLGMQEDEAIAHPWVSKAIENAQRKVEAHNFDIRKNLLEYDNVANDQRTVIYSQRNELLEAEDISATVDSIRADVVASFVSGFIPPGSLEEQWDTDGLQDALEREFGIKLEISKWLEQDDSLHEETLHERVRKEIDEAYRAKESMMGPAQMRRLEKFVMLQVLDNQWKEHLAAMDHLRQSIGLRGYAQKNPKQEYKRESFEMFARLLDSIKTEVVRILSRIRLSEDSNVQLTRQQQQQRKMQYNHPQAQDALHPEAAEKAERTQPFVRQQQKLGRNDPCFCGSGKKFKQCHGKLA
jgi:preprotein translocase subunit SecA